MYIDMEPATKYKNRALKTAGTTARKLFKMQ